MPEFIVKRFLLKGRVQGVGCRAQVRSKAAGLGLEGWVRNLGDDRVEILARGSPEAMEAFEVLLRAGLRFPVRIDEVSVEDWAAIGISASDFEVREDADRPL